jgi:hypothetical protein
MNENWCIVARRFGRGGHCSLWGRNSSSVYFICTCSMCHGKGFTCAIRYASLETAEEEIKKISEDELRDRVVTVEMYKHVFHEATLNQSKNRI